MKQASNVKQFVNKKTNTKIDLDGTIDSLVRVIHCEVTRLLGKSLSLEGLDPDDVRACNEFARTCVLIRKDDRANRLGVEEIVQMTDEQLDSYLKRMGYQRIQDKKPVGGSQ